MLNPSNVLESVRIVEYEPAYAQAVADMWNASQESWGGGNRVRSAEQVARDMENAGNLKVFVALSGDEVVGFCSFSHYKHDEGALYVPLLNVRPDYHGRKVGRSLILKAVETTVEMGWPRLDLFTWAGNTKAVPMYKKCGFFWEKKDDSVHLMNFIPTVLQTEALQPYLGRIDWYADSVRPLEIRPDGRMENGFDCFEYAWEKDGTSLRVEFEKSGRGLRLIDTDDYSIHTEIESHGLVFGSHYPVRYVIRNKSGQPLECTIRGRDDKNIRFGLLETVQVHDTVVVEGLFELGSVLQEQNDWKTHPTVVSEWTINGRKAEFRTGIAPKFPAKVKLEVHNQEHYTDVLYEGFLTFQNNYPTDADFVFELPESDFIAFGNSQIAIRIPGKGKATLPLSYKLRNFGLFSVDIEMKAVPDNGAPVTFFSKLHGIFKGNAGRYGGDIVDSWVIVNGPYTLGMNKTTNELWTAHFQGSHYRNWWSSPRIGKPYSLEFSKRKAESVQIYEDGETMVLEADYRSEDFPGIALKAFARLNANGIAEHDFEVRNESGETLQDDLYLNDAFSHGAKRLVLPYDGNYYDLEDGYAANYDDWDIDRISENWLFSRNDKLATGFWWHPSAKLVKTEWYLGVEYELGRLTAGETIRTKSTYLAIGTFADWWDFRSYAMKKTDPDRPLLRDHFEICASGNNPFTRPGSKFEIRQHRNQPLDGEMTLSSPTGGFDSIRHTFRREDAVRSAEFPFPATMKTGTIHQIQMKFEAENLRLERSTVFVPVHGESVANDIREGAAGETYRSSNGTLSIEASPGFGAALHSLKYNGEEWLDSSFPEPGPRSWWNPWLGGIAASINDISGLSLQEEERKADFVSLTDNLGNEWSGIALHTDIQKHEAYRGMELSLYTLLLPGAPVLCCVNRITNRTGLAYTHFQSSIEGFLQLGNSLTEGWIETSNDHIRYKCGTVGQEIGSEGIVRFGSERRSTILHAVNRYPGTDVGVYANNVLTTYGCSRVSQLAAGHSVWSAPVFFAFADSPLTYQELRGLADIRFDDNRGQ